MSQHDTDILIAGGGLAGATLALAIAKLVPQLRVTVVEAFPLSAEAAPQDYQPSYDARSTALAWGSRQIFSQLGLWSRIAGQATPIEHIHVSDRGRFGATRLAAADHGQAALGYVVDNRWLGLCLTGALHQQAGIHWLAPARVDSVTPLGEGVSVVIDADGEPRTLSAHCLVVADGGRSGLREQLGFDVRHHDYDQHALIANVSTARPHDFTAYERFTDAGPMALLPAGNPEAGGHTSALVWTLDPAALEEVLSLTPEQQCERLQQRFGWRLGRFTRIGHCSHYPLALTTATEVVRPGIALVGNAAHALHPVAGQGFNLALRGLMTLVEQFREAVETDLSPGDLRVLRGYQERHRDDRDRTVLFSDSLIQLFGSRIPGLGVARDAGLVGLDLVPGARKWFARQAMGLGGRRSITRTGARREPRP